MKFKLVPALAGALFVSAAATADITNLTTEVKINDETTAAGLGLSVTPFQPYPQVVVLPSSTAPCSRSRAVAGASTSQACRA